MKPTKVYHEQNDLTQPQCINNKQILNFLYGRGRKEAKTYKLFYKPRHFLCETRDMNIEPPNIENLVLLCVWADQAVLGSTETAH